jgi:tellurite resistance protein TehA-like permease
MTKLTRRSAIAFALIFIGLGFFAGFPYFMQAPPMRLHEEPWFAGAAMAFSFALGGFLLGEARHI